MLLQGLLPELKLHKKWSLEDQIPIQNTYRAQNSANDRMAYRKTLKR